MVPIAKTLRDLTALVIAFRDERDWKKFHTPKDLAISLSLEAAELLETTQWKSNEEIATRWATDPALVGDELADVLYWLLLIAEESGIDLEEQFLRKLKLNADKYPVEAARGRSDKYNAYRKGRSE